MSIDKSLPWESFPEAFASDEAWNEDCESNETGSDHVDHDRLFAEILIQGSQAGEVRFPLDFCRFTV